ncbi:MAG: DNA polymerase Y family protein [Planctomycetota bacterium]
MPDFAIDRQLRAQADANTTRLALSAPERGRDLIVAASPAACACGVRARQTASAARALCAGLQVRPYDDENDCSALEALAAQLICISPDLALDPRLSGSQRGIFVEISRTQDLFGGELATLQGAHRLVHKLGYRAVVAVSPGFASSRILSWSQAKLPLRMKEGEARKALGPLPWAALELPSAKARDLQELGVQTLADLLALPRAGLAARFGDEVAKACDQALGEGGGDEQLPRFKAPKIYRERLEWWPPRGDLGPILFAAKRLFDAAENWLSAQQKALVEARLTIGLSEKGQKLPLRLRPSAPLASAESLNRLLQSRLESIELPAAAENVELLFIETSSLCAEQGELFEAPQRAWQQESYQLLDRLRGRLGEHRVLRAELLAESRPEYAFAWREFGGAGQTFESKVKTLVPSLRRPLFLESPPRPLQVSCDAAGRPQSIEKGPQRGPLRCASGPERIEGGWWEGRPVRRHYFEVETKSGAHLWIFRDLLSGAWFQHGTFD